MITGNIKSYWLLKNDEDDYYSLEISTSEKTISFPKVIVQFVSSDDIAFPISFTTFSDDGTQINEYSLIQKKDQITEEPNT